MPNPIVSAAPRNPATQRIKPEKPRPDFPLFPHASGKWAKTIRGKTHYFGSWSDPHGAESEYLAVAEDLHAGRTPQPRDDGRLITVRDLSDRFLATKRKLQENGKLSPRTLIDYTTTCRKLKDKLGNHAVHRLTPSDFESLYHDLSEKYKAETLRGMITVIRGVFKYGEEMDLIDRAPKFGPVFKAPSRDKVQKEKNVTEEENGLRLMTAEEIRNVLAIASSPLKAMVLLGVNCGLGNTDVSEMPISAIDFKTGWLNYPRPKTGRKRRCRVWPETLDALQTALAERPKPIDPADSGVFFVTKYGQRWVRFSVVEEIKRGIRHLKPKQDDAICKGFKKLLSELGIARKGLSFYALRHTHRTVSGGAKDPEASDFLMGHCSQAISDKYIHGHSDERLIAVVNHIRGWLFPPPQTSPEPINGNS